MHGKGCGGFGGWNDKVWLIARTQAAGGGTLCTRSATLPCAWG